MKLRKLAVIGLIALVGVACSKGGGSGAAGGSLLQLVSDSASKTTDAGSSKVSLTINASVAGRSFSIAGDGAFDYTNKKGELTLNIPNAGSIQEIVIGGKVFVKSPASSKFIEMDLSQFTSSSNGLGSADPSQILQYLKGVSSDLKDEGQDTVRGVSMRHIHATIDLSKAAAALSGPEKSAVEQLPKLIGTSSLPVDVWIDSQGRLGKFTMTLNFNAPTAGGSGTIGIDMELFDFGTPVNVQAPPPSEVTQGGSTGGPFG